MASNCGKPLDIYLNSRKKIVGFENIIEKIKETLQKTNLTEVENSMISDFFSNEDTYIEFKVARKGPLEICVVSLNNRKCFEIRCDCKDVSRQHGQGSLRSTYVTLLCKAKTHNDSLQDRSCQEKMTVDTYKNKTLNRYQLEVTSSKAGKSFIDQYTSTILLNSI
ncbi:uncharacterized protein LOC134269875 [Saccostrea cucullata]|uniref:uncharacterized protein LOC134269875 n=1 Tax=Saccostrea cuccullata TaxID=36930 RepID=UPI002ED207D9